MWHRFMLSLCHVRVRELKSCFYLTANTDTTRFGLECEANDNSSSSGALYAFTYSGSCLSLDMSMTPAPYIISSPLD